ncbi:lebercilin isoform X1 [Hypanus sabinus]|uniref:lebercilin isoform X1 n=1 Tax=Hypanus sabinus TaxID=79690 RepID=UPI0028C3D8C5|nr:lebercilin isoform X1 [Hypanus sabinus]
MKILSSINMDSQNGYNDEDNSGNSEAGRSLCSGASTQRKLVTNDKKENKSKPTQLTGSTMRDHEKTENMDYDKNSDSYYSDDYDNSSYMSDSYCSENSRSRTPSPRRKEQVKQKASSYIHDRAVGKSGARQPASHGNRQSRTQRLNKEPVSKDIDLVTKRMLSARLLKINELRNEVTELQGKLEDLQKENKILKRLQYRQEKALSKFEDTENEISMLISRHNNEVRILRERLRKSQEKERAMEKQLKDTEEELHRTKNSLLKLKKLSEDKHLIERDELAQKLAKAEIKMENSERRIKDLQRNLELTNNSFLRQVTSERKKAQEAQEDIRNLQEEIQRLGQKLKEKEKELDVKNIYANRILKSSPKKEGESTPKRKASSTVKGVQTEEYYLPLVFPTPPLATGCEEEMRIKGDCSQAIQEHHDGEWTECLRREEMQEPVQESEEKLKREEQHRLELKAEKLRESKEWEQEEQERKTEEKEKEKKKGTKFREEEHENSEKMDERRKKEILLAKMREIDEETSENSLFSPHENTTYTFSIGNNSPERLQKNRNFQESEQTPAETYGRRNYKTTDIGNELSFGTYAPSFGKGNGRPGPVILKGNNKEEQTNGYFDIPVKDKRPNLIDQLFGSGSGVRFTSKEDDVLLNPIQKSNWNSNPFPWEKTSSHTRKNEMGDHVFTDAITSSNRHRSKYTSVKPAIKAIDSLEDEIEEVVL